MATERIRSRAASSLLLVVLILWSASLQAVSPGSSSSHGWRLHSQLPEGRASMIALPGKAMCLMGGNFWKGNEKVFASDGFQWNDTLQLWNPAERHFTCPPYAAVAHHAKVLHLYGGQPGTWITYDAETNSIHEREILHARNHATSVLREGGLWIIGGEQPEQKGKACSTLVLDTGTGLLKQSLPSPTRKALVNPLALAGDHAIQVLGGGQRSGAGIINSDTIHEWDEASATWKIIGRMPGALRGLMGIRINSEAWFIGGGYSSDNQAFSKQAWLYFPYRADWHSLPDLPEGIMQGCVFVRNGSVFVAGGEVAPRKRSDRVYILPADVVERYLLISN